MSSFEIEEIKKILNKQSIFFSEAFMYRFLPHFNKLIELIKKNYIGELSSIESCFGIVNKVLCKDSKMDLMDLISFLTNRPREIMGFDCDLFSVGSSAEIVVIDPEQDWVFSRQDIKSRSINSPYIGKELFCKVQFTISRSYLYKSV